MSLILKINSTVYSSLILLILLLIVNNQQIFVISLLMLIRMCLNKSLFSDWLWDLSTLILTQSLWWYNKLILCLLLRPLVLACFFRNRAKPTTIPPPPPRLWLKQPTRVLQTTRTSLLCRPSRALVFTVVVAAANVVDAQAGLGRGENTHHSSGQLVPYK